MQKRTLQTRLTLQKSLALEEAALFGHIIQQFKRVNDHHTHVGKCIQCGAELHYSINPDRYGGTALVKKCRVITDFINRELPSTAVKQKRD